MTTRAVDKAVGSVFREFGKSDLKPDQRRKLEGRFHKSLGARPLESRALLIRAFEQIRYHWHESSRLPVKEYDRTVQELVEHGLVQAGAGAFLACLDSFAKYDLEPLDLSAPNEICIEAWLKARKANKQAIQKTVAAQPETYLQTAFADWYVKKAPLKSVLTFGRLAILKTERPNYLPTSRQLLVQILKRDKKHVLADGLVREAIHSKDAMAELMSAAMAHRKYLEPLARSFGNVLAGQIEEPAANAVVALLGETVQAEQPNQVGTVSQFAAHVATTWALARDPRKSSLPEALWAELASKAVIRDQTTDQASLWIACQASVLMEKLLTPGGKLSSQGALQLALALRSAQSGADSFDALWAAGFNLGICEIGQKNDEVVFDPQLHEDTQGGLLRGNAARIEKCGWEFDGDVLVRAEVNSL